MLVVSRAGLFGNRYVVSVNGHPVGEWRAPHRREAGGSVVGGQFYPVEAAPLLMRFTMFDGSGTPIATAENIGRPNWTAYADGRYHRFRRPSVLGSTMMHVVADRDVGWIRQRRILKVSVEAELPMLSLLAQVFIAGAVITIWDRRLTSTW